MRIVQHQPHAITIVQHSAHLVAEIKHFAIAAVVLYSDHNGQWRRYTGFCFWPLVCE